MSVARAQREIDSEEFAEWQAYRRLYPFGDSLQMMLIAHMCSCVVNVLKAPGDPLWKWEHFYPAFGEPEETEETVIELDTERPLKQKKAVAVKLREFLMMNGGKKVKDGNTGNSSNEDDIKRHPVRSGSGDGEKRSEGG
jgi:hypothetical protein